MKHAIFAVVLSALALPAGAKPLITSSEETLARICLAAEDSPDRLVEACTLALDEPGLTDRLKGDLYVGLGDAHVWAGDDAAAEEAYRAGHDADPQNVDALNGLGWVLRTTADDHAALAVFETSLEVDVSVQGLAGKAATGRATGAISNDDARQMLRAALTIDPQYSWAIREIAWSHYDESQWADAIPVFREALDLDATDLNALYGVGRSAVNLNDYEQALDAFNTSLEFDPDDISSRVYRIVSLRGLDRNAQALRDSNRLIEDFPDSTSGYVEKGLSLMALQRRKEAIETYRDAHAIFGPNNTILYWHADALATDGAFDDALDLINQGIGLDGADYSDYLLKSYIALELENYPLAREAAEASLAMGVNDPWAHYYAAIALVHDGDAAKGIERFDTAITGGLPEDRVGAFARELISAGKFVEAMQLRMKY